jgi:hypothetical protein
MLHLFDADHGLQQPRPLFLRKGFGLLYSPCLFYIKTKTLAGNSVTHTTGTLFYQDTSIKLTHDGMNHHFQQQQQQQQQQPAATHHHSAIAVAL